MELKTNNDFETFCMLKLCFTLMDSVFSPPLFKINILWPLLFNEKKNIFKICPSVFHIFKGREHQPEERGQGCSVANTSCGGQNQVK